MWCSLSVHRAVSLSQSMCRVGVQLSPELLESFLLELDRHGSSYANPPSSLAEELAEVIHDE